MTPAVYPTSPIVCSTVYFGLALPQPSHNAYKRGRTQNVARSPRVRAVGQRLADEMDWRGVTANNDSHKKAMARVSFLRQITIMGPNHALTVEIDSSRPLKDGVQNAARPPPLQWRGLHREDPGWECNSPSHSAIQHALTLAKKTLNRYYSLTDESEVYRITMVLHPQHKLDYFPQARWLPEWIETAKMLGGGEDNDDDDENTSSSGKSEINVKESKNIFDNLLAYKHTSKSKSVADELQLYLSTPTENAAQPLLWWYEKRHVYSQLHRMALDYLSIPAQTTQALLCLGSWSLAGLVRDEDVKAVAVLDEVSSRTGHT
ncbi:hypothetical protein GALMADRAFT_215786 [Galerina marginata CBS 339.88]|uniref:HAT C-terminal dimerisation domain-containing protein n=1 Tax=Galerina marginata (strain CBS 339.88) TaxID=685588 RepID=A0A067SKS6_GALM3|nr:hypothetical protein GALMADRAFT_215786 [Galerina marginata CBS 339.88]